MKVIAIDFNITENTSVYHLLTSVALFIVDYVIIRLRYLNLAFVLPFIKCHSVRDKNKFKAMLALKCFFLDVRYHLKIVGDGKSSL